MRKLLALFLSLTLFLNASFALVNIFAEEDANVTTEETTETSDQEGEESHEDDEQTVVDDTNDQDSGEETDDNSDTNKEDITLVEDDENIKGGIENDTDDITMLDSNTYNELNDADDSELLEYILMEDNTYSVKASDLALAVTSITIPESYHGLPVSRIATNGFKDLPDLSEIVLPDSLTSIGSNAFSNCTSLHSITIPKSVTKIGSKAFVGSGLVSANFESTSGWTVENDATASGKLSLTYGNGNSTFNWDKKVKLGTTLIKQTWSSNIDFDMSSVAEWSCSYYPNSVEKFASALTKAVTTTAKYTVKSYIGPTSETRWSGSISIKYFEQTWTRKVPVAAVSFVSDNYVVGINNTYQLETTVTPFYATNKELNYVSSDPSVVSVNSDGLLTANATGTAFITVTTTDGSSLSATCSVTVVEQTYTISWLNYDGDILETDLSVLEGSFPSFDGTTPVREPDDNFTYIFKGWSPELTNVTSDITYTAQFAKTDKWLTAFDYTANGDVITLTKYKTGSGSDLTIKSTVLIENNLYQHVKLGEKLFNGNQEIRNLSMIGPVIFPEDSSYLFAGSVEYTKFESISMSEVDTSNVQDMSNMFHNCSSLGSLNVSSFDTSNVTNMAAMFYNCPSLISLDLRNFDTSSVEDMGAMFNGCSSLISIDLSNFNTSNVEYLGSMFSGCTSLASLDLSSFDTSNVTETEAMYEMFHNCPSLETVRLGSGFTSWIDDAYLTAGTWHNEEKGLVKTERELYSDYSSHSSEWAGTWIRVFTVSSGDCGDNVSYELANTGELSISGMGPMFDFNENETPWNQCLDQITSVKIEEGITKIGDNAFNGCTSLIEVVIPDSVVSIGNSAFEGCTSLETIYIPNSVTELGTDAFARCSTLTVTIGCDSPLTDEDLANAGATSYVREDHDIVHVESVKPTEDHSGNIEYWYCTRCGKCFADSDGTQEIDIEDTVIKNEEYGDIIPEDRPLTPSLIPDGIWLSAIDDVEYDPLNKTYTPSFRVYDHTRMLNKSTDYNVSFKNNSKAGIASVTVTGKGDYIGTYTGYFNILPKQFDDEFKVVLNNDSFKYANGKVLRPTVSVEYKGVKLKDKTDYTISYENINSRSPGHYSVNIKGSGNYEGTLTASYQIMESDSELIPISSVKISSIKKMTYTGDPLVQDLILTNGKITLKKGTDYEIVYYDNIDAGTAYLTISGIGDYTGSITKSFKIEPLKLTTKNTSVDKLPVSLEYEGKALRPDIDVYLDGKILALDEDYTLTYTNNINVGTAKITVKGTGNYTGTINKNFKIVKKEIPEQSITVSDSFAYEKGGVMPVPEIIIDGTELVYNKDFTVSYKNNKNVNDGYDLNKTPMMTVTGKGNYTGKYEYYFTIHEKDLSEVDIYIPDKIYSNKANAYKSVPVLTDTNGKKLSAGTDYDKNYDYFIDDKPVAGIPSPGTTVTVKVTGKGNYRGLIVGEYRIVSYDIAKAKVTIPVQYYTGRPIKPSYDDITVEINKIKLSKDDYEIVSYSNNVNKGTAKVTIKGKGQYGGTKTVNFTIKQRSLGNTIHFNLNGGSGTLNDQLIYKDTALSNYNGKKTVNGITYTFKGWSTTLNGDIIYRNKQLFIYDPKMAGRTVTLYAVWE